MPYLNFRLRAMLAAGLLLLGVPGLHAQDAPATGTIRGDVDGDGRVTRADAEAVRTFLVRGTLPGGRSILPAGDANADGRVTGADAVLISRYVAGVDVSRFPVGRPVIGTGRAPTADETGMLVSEFECEMTVANGTTTCRPVTPGVNGARADIIVGVPYVTITGSKIVSNGDQSNPDTSTVTYTLTNKIPQPIGTTDGTTLHPNGSRMFFTSVPQAKNVSNQVLPAVQVTFDPLPDSATFTSAATGETYVNKKYVQFNKVLPLDSAVMAAQPVRFVYNDPTKVVNSIVVNVKVATPVQFEHGWITVAPASVPILSQGQTATLSGTVYDQVGRMQADGITWSSSNSAVAGVNASTGVVTAGSGSGTATITATSTVNSNRTGTRIITVDQFPTVVSTTPVDDATGVLPGSSIQITFSEAVNVTGATFSLECPAGSSQAFSVSGSGTSTITLDPTSDLPGATNCVVTVDGNEVHDSDANDGPDMMPGNYSFNFETAIQAVDDAFGPTTGNVEIDTDSTSFSVKTNDKLTPSTTITFFGWGPTSGKTLQQGDVVMDSDGTFTYNPPAGFEGIDSLAYVVQAGSVVDTGKVALQVDSMIWFVRNGAPSCTSRAAGCGRLKNPYSSLAAFSAENNGTGNNPAAGDVIFLYENAAAYSASVTLLAEQKLIGQDAGQSLSAITGISPAPGSLTLPAMNTGGSAATIDGTVTLSNIGANAGANNTVRGLSIAASNGSALVGTSFGSPVIAEVSLSATNGAALNLSGGTVNSTFASATSTNSTGRGISLTNVSGSLAFTAGSISGAAQAAFLVSGGNVGVTWPGSIGQASVTPLLAVSGGHSGTLTFSGALTSTGGPGMQFNDADGTYNLNGTANLSGDSAAVDITNGSGGTFNFNAGTQITNAAGAANSAFYVYGSAPTLVSYAGSITKSGTSAGRLVELGEMTGGTVTFTSSSSLGATSTSASSTGISLSNVAAAVNFNGTTNLSGGDAGIDILSGSSGTFTFGANTLVQNPTGTAFNVNGSAPNITFNGSLIRTANNALLVDLTTVAAGKTITFDPAAGTDSLYATVGDGIQLSNVDGAVDFNGPVRLAGGPAVDIISGSSGNIDFDAITVLNPATEALRIFNGSGGDQAADVSFAGSITTNAARPVLIEDVSSGTVAVSASINTSAGLGLLVQNNSGGTITFSNATQSLNTAGNAAVTLANNTGSTVNFTGGSLAITTAAGAGFTASGGGTVNVTGSTNTVSSGSGTAVSIANTTIGGSGVTFRSVSATGAPNGILLNTTGGGAFSVAGNGGSCTVATPTCTGGLITGTSGAGVSLNATGAVSLTRLRVQNSQSHGITASGSTNLTLTSSYLQSNGNGDEENDLNLLNASGTVLVDASSFNGAAENLIRVDNNNANLTFTVQNASSFEFPNPESSAFRNSAILITPKGSSAVTATVTGSTFRNIPNYSFQFAPDASVTATGSATFTNNTLSADVGLNVTCASNPQCRVGHIGVGGTGGTTNFVATGNNFNRVNGDGVFILGANQSSTLRMRIDNNTISNALDDAFVVGLGQSARVIAQFNGNTISNIGADVLEVASGEVNAGFGAGSASDMDLVFTNNSMNTVGTNSSLTATGGPGVFRFGDADQLLCLAFTGNSMSGPLPTSGLKVYLDGNFGGLGGSMTYEGTGTGALTDAKIQADNPGMSLAPANTVISAVNLSNGATCQRPGI